MATLATFTIPADTFPLGSIFEHHPGVTVELERVIPTSDAIIPYFWIRGAGDAEEEGIEAAFRDHPDVRTIEQIDSVDDEYLMRVEWWPEYDGILDAIVNTDVVLISGIGTAEEWTIEVRADEREAISDFQRYCREHALPVELTGLHALSSIESEPEYDLTRPQRDALILAYERGYYQSPRAVTLEQMAEELEITGQSLGSRLRRGIHRLIGSTLMDPSD